MADELNPQNAAEQNQPSPVVEEPPVQVQETLPEPEASSSATTPRYAKILIIQGLLKKSGKTRTIRYELFHR